MSKRIGIICHLEFTDHPEFKSIYCALANLYQTPKLVKEISDLAELDILFIGDDHFGYHKIVWQQEGFIDYCNDHNLTVVVFTPEKIFNSVFPWNKDIYVCLKEIKNLYHYTSDVDDCELLGTRLHRISISKSVYPHSIKCDDKKDKAIFVGNVDDLISDSYTERKEVLSEIKKIMELDIISTKTPLWKDYMQLIAGYRFVISPIGNANFFPMRFYEILAVKSIPIHQVRKNTLEYYDIESKFDDCIFFQHSEELPKKLESFMLKESHNMLWLEDTIEFLLRKDGLLY